MKQRYGNVCEMYVAKDQMRELSWVVIDNSGAPGDDDYRSGLCMTNGGMHISLSHGELRKLHGLIGEYLADLDAKPTEIVPAAEIHRTIAEGVDAAEDLSREYAVVGGEG